MYSGKLYFVRLLCYCFFISINSLSQNKSIHFTKIDVDDGLSQNQVHCVYQDSKELLWFGTEDGLNLYDGYSFRVFRYQPGNENSLLGYAVNAICESEEGIFWIGTREGLSKFNLRTGKFTHYIHNPDLPNSLVDNSIWCITKDSENNLWIGTKNGLSHFNPQTEIFTNYSHSESNKNTISNNYILSIVEDADKNIWIGGRGGLDRFNLKSKKFFNYKIHPENPKSVVLNGIICECISNGTLWLGTYSGLYSVNLSDALNDKIIFRQQLLDSKNQSGSNKDSDHMLQAVRSIYAGSDNTIWAGTYGSGLIRYKPLSNEAIIYKSSDQPGSLSENYIIAVLEDKHNVLWVGTSSSGLNKHNISSEKFNLINLQDEQGSGNAHVSAVLEDRIGDLWIGTELGTIFKLDNSAKNNSSFRQYETKKFVKAFFKSVEIRSFMEDNTGKIWAGSFGDGIFIIDPSSDEIKKLKQGNNNRDYISNDFIHCIYQSSDGIIWIGTGAGGISKYDPAKNEFTYFQHDPENNKSVSNNEVTAIVEDNQKNIWAGTSTAGLNLLHRESGEFEHFTQDLKNIKSISSNRIVCLLNDHQGNLWIGTFGGGLNRWNPKDKSFEHYTTDNGLPSNTIYSIIEDHSGNLWISTDKGISLFKVREDLFKNFDEKDGLQGNEFLQTSAYVSKTNGNIYFGGVNGVNFFKAEDLYKQSIPSNIILTDFLLFNRSILPGKDSLLKTNILFADEVTLSHDQNFITFEFASLDFNNPDKNKYAYKMEGFNQDWIYSGNQRFATFTNLDAGEYTLKVKGTNSDGLWNETGTSIKILILPPWWRTWWAYLLYTAVIFITLLFVRQFEMKRVQLKNELQVRNVEAKKLQEIDKMKSRFFANISHEFRTPLTLILGLTEKLSSSVRDISAKKDFVIIKKNAVRLLQLINQLLELSKLESGSVELKVSKQNINIFLKRILSSFTSLAEKKSVAIIFNDHRLDENSVQKEVFLYFDPEKLETVFYNLLGNAFKFSPDGERVEVEVIPHIHKVEIRFTNTGIGISEEKLPNIFNRFYQADETASRNYEGTGIGLALVKELIELHGGEISVMSVENKETTFTIKIPVGRAHYKPEQVVEETEYVEKENDHINFDEEYNSDSEVRPQKIQDNNYKIILVVEDNHDLRNYIVDLLLHEDSNGERKYLVYEAENGEKGLKTAAEIIPDLIISDIMMPEMDGYEMCRRIKKNFRTSHVPIIMLTAKAERDDKLEGLETGADDYLLKPFDSKELLIRVRNLIRIREQMREKYRTEMLLKPKEVNVPSTEKIFIEKLTLIIEKNISNEKFGVDTLSDQIGLSRSQLHRKLKAITDQSTTEFIRNFRLQRAADLILQNFGNMAEITYKVGFSSQSYFTKCFTDYFGCSPVEYGRQKSGKK